MSKSADLTAGRLLPVLPQCRAYDCTAKTDVKGQFRK